MKNQVIKVLNRAHGKKVIDYWKSKGVNTVCYSGYYTEEDGNHAIYYGVINGNFNNYDLATVKEYNAEIIELPKENQYPKLMWVSDFPGGVRKKRVVFMEKRGTYLSWSSAETIEESLESIHVTTWAHAEDIQEEVIIELTLEDISAGKGVGVPVHLLRIKK